MVVDNIAFEEVAPEQEHLMDGLILQESFESGARRESARST